VEIKKGKKRLVQQDAMHKPIRQRLHEENERVLFCIRPNDQLCPAFILAVDSGAGQQVVPSPGSWSWQRGSTSRVF
jgi:hypothetical protein